MPVCVQGKQTILNIVKKRKKKKKRGEAVRWLAQQIKVLAMQAKYLNSTTGEICLSSDQNMCALACILNAHI